jgi:hypothetical protein
VSPDGRRAATLSSDDTVRVWELATGKSLRTVPAPRGKASPGWEGPRRRVAFTPDGRGVLFASAGELVLIDPATGRQLDLPAGLRACKECVGELSADGRTLATFVGDRVILRNWPAATTRATVTVPLAVGKKPVAAGGPEVVTVSSATLSPTAGPCSPPRSAGPRAWAAAVTRTPTTCGTAGPASTCTG